MAFLVISSEEPGGAALVAWINEQRTMRDMRPPCRQGTLYLYGLATDKKAAMGLIMKLPLQRSNRRSGVRPRCAKGKRSGRFGQDRARPPALECSDSSLRLGFQVSQVCVELVLRDSLAAVELAYAAPNFRIDGVPDLQEPAVLFFLGIEKPERQHQVRGEAKLHGSQPGDHPIPNFASTFDRRLSISISLPTSRLKLASNLVSR